MCSRKRSRYRVNVQESIFSHRLAEALADPWNDEIVTDIDALSDLDRLPVGNRDDEISYELAAVVAATLTATRCRTSPSS